MIKLKFSQNLTSWTYIKKNSAHSLLDAWSFLLVHIWSKPNEVPEGFVNWFVKKSDHGSWIIKSDHGKKDQLPLQSTLSHFYQTQNTYSWNTKICNRKILLDFDAK